MDSTDVRVLLPAKSPLPPNPYHPGLPDSPPSPTYEAYKHALHIERWIVTTPGKGNKEATTVDHVLEGRVLGYLLIEWPNSPGRYTMTHEINSCHNDDDRLLLARSYIHHILNYCKYIPPDL